MRDGPRLYLPRLTGNRRIHMKDLWFGIGHFIQGTFDWFLTPFGWLPVTIFVIVMALGALYWLMLQGRYNRRAKENNELM